MTPARQQTVRREGAVRQAGPYRLMELPRRRGPLVVPDVPRAVPLIGLACLAFWVAVALAVVWWRRHA